MPFSGLFSSFRHKIQTDTLAPAAFLCPFQNFFLPLGINIFFISCERMLLLCHKILLINLLTSFVNSFSLFFTYFNLSGGRKRKYLSGIDQRRILYPGLIQFEYFRPSVPGSKLSPGDLIETVILLYLIPRPGQSFGRHRYRKAHNSHQYCQQKC